MRPSAVILSRTFSFKGSKDRRYPQHARVSAVCWCSRSRHLRHSPDTASVLSTRATVGRDSWPRSRSRSRCAVFVSMLPGANSFEYASGGRKAAMPVCAQRSRWAFLPARMVKVAKVTPALPSEYAAWCAKAATKQVKLKKRRCTAPTSTVDGISSASSTRRPAARTKVATR